jgi:hypothetical protein
MALRVRVITTLTVINLDSPMPHPANVITLNEVDPAQLNSWLANRTVDYTDDRGLRMVVPFENVVQLEAYPQPVPA